MAMGAMGQLRTRDMEQGGTMARSRPVACEQFIGHDDPCCAEPGLHEMQILVQRAQAAHEGDGAIKDKQHPEWEWMVRHPHRPARSSHRLRLLLPLATQAQLSDP